MDSNKKNADRNVGFRPKRTSTNGHRLQGDLSINKGFDDNLMSIAYLQMRNDIYESSNYGSKGDPSPCMTCRRYYDGNFMSASQIRKPTACRRCVMCIKLGSFGITREADFEEEEEESGSEEQFQQPIKKEDVVRVKTEKVEGRGYVRSYEEVQDVTEEENAKRRRKIEEEAVKIE